MRYLKYLCLLLLCVLISCTKTEEHIVILELDIPEGIMPPEGGCVNVRIRANYSWWLEGESKWCVPSIKEGSASEEGELVIFEADAAPESRTARFSFHCGLKKVVFCISQKKKDVLYATGETRFCVPAEGCRMQIPVDSNCEYEIIVSDHCKGWISLVDSVDNEGFALTFAANDSGMRRSADVVVRSKTDNSVSLIYTLTQPDSENSISYTTKADGPIKLYHADRLGSEVISHTAAYGFGVIECAEPITQIGDEAFKYASDITSITLPSNVSTIGQAAFLQCSSLKSITGYENVRSLEPYAFESCSALESFIIPEGITEISDGLFKGCNSLSEVIIPDTVTSVGEAAFDYCSSLVSLELPDGITRLGSKAFAHCSALEGVDLPSGIKEISSLLFYECSALKSIKIPTGVKLIGQWAFGACVSLENVTIPETVIEIKYRAFSGSTSLRNIILPESLKTLGNDIFRECTGLEEIVIPEGVNLDSDTNFGLCHDCFGLKKAKLPDSWNAIPQNTFTNCHILESYHINDNVRFIAGAAFAGCHGLTEIHLPEGVISISSDAFKLCSSLKKIYLSPTEPPLLGEESFDLEIADRVFYVPQSSLEAYKEQWSQYADQIVGL